MTRCYYLTILKATVIISLVFTSLITYSQKKTDELKYVAQKANNYFLEADSLLKEDNISASVSSFEKAIKLYKTIYSSKDERFANIYATVGQLMVNANQQNLAIEYCNKALSLIRNGTPLEAYKKAKLYHTIAKTYKAQELYSLSLEFFKEAISQYDNLNPDCCLQDKLLAILQAGKISYQLHYYIQATEYYKSSLSILDKINYGDISPEHAIVYHNLGNSYLNLNEADSAIEVFEKGLIINEEIFGEYSAENIESHKNLVNAYFVNGNYEKTWEESHKVIKLYNKADIIYKEDLIEYCYTQARNHIHIKAYHTASYWFEKYFQVKYNPYLPNASYEIDEFIEIGDLFMQRSTLTHGLIFYKHGLDYYDRLEKKDVKISAELAYNIGNIYWEMKSSFRAYEYYKKSVSTFANYDVTKAADCLSKLSQIYQEQGQRMAQVSSLIKSFELLRTEGLVNQSAQVLKKISETYYNYQQYDSALLYANKLVSTYETFTNHLEKKNAYILLANIYNAKKETSTAFKFYNKVLISEPEVFEYQVDASTFEANKNLYEIYSDTGELDKAQKHANNAEKMRKALQGTE